MPVARRKAVTWKSAHHWYISLLDILEAIIVQAAFDFHVATLLKRRCLKVPVLYLLPKIKFHLFFHLYCFKTAIQIHSHQTKACLLLFLFGEEGTFLFVIRKRLKDEVRGGSEDRFLESRKEYCVDCGTSYP